LVRQREAEKAAFDRVLLIRIQHHATLSSEATLDVHRRAPPDAGGFAAAFAAPVQAVLAVRDQSQLERGQIETELLEQISLLSQVVEKLASGLSSADGELQRQEMQQYSKVLSKSRFQRLAPPQLKVEIQAESEQQHSEDEVDEPIDWIVKVVSLAFALKSGEDAPPPLNWKLTPQQFARYQETWNALVADEGPAIKALDDLFLERGGDAPEGGGR